MADTLMLSIEILRVSAIVGLHVFGQGWRIGFNQQMAVIVHQAISVAIPIVAIDRILQQHQKLLTISIITLDVFPSVTSRSHIYSAPANSILKGIAICASNMKLSWSKIKATWHVVNCKA
jgi:hypothetical protein